MAAVEAPGARSSMPQVPRRLFTVAETAQILGIGRSKVYELINSGRLASVRIDGARRVAIAAIDRYIQQLGNGSGR